MRAGAARTRGGPALLAALTAGMLAPAVAQAHPVLKHVSYRGYRLAIPGGWQARWSQPVGLAETIRKFAVAPVPAACDVP